MFYSFQEKIDIFVLLSFPDRTWSPKDFFQENFAVLRNVIQKRAEKNSRTNIFRTIV